MSLLNPLHIALQGLFPLTPIALAVQGLLEELIEEEKRSQVYGSGKPAKRVSQAKTQSQRRDDPSIEKVLEKWDYIERARERDKPKPEPEKPKEKLAKPVEQDPAPKLPLPEIALPGALKPAKFVPVPIVTAPAVIAPSVSSVSAVPPQDVLQNDDDDALLLIMELL